MEESSSEVRMDNEANWISEEVEKLFQEDQSDRELLHKSDGSLNEDIRNRDRQRIEKARNLLKKSTITNPHELHMLAIVFQHGEDVADIQKALDLSMQAVKNGLPPRYSLVPQATDRLMVYEQQKKGVPPEDILQKFGTQSWSDGRGFYTTYMIDGSATREDLEKYGLQENSGNGDRGIDKS